MLRSTVAETFQQLNDLTCDVGKGVVAFDADGTLWTGDVADDVIHALLDKRLVREDALPAFAEELARLGTPSPSNATDAFIAIAQLDREKRLDHGRTCELIGSLSAGWTVEEFHAFCVSTLTAAKLSSRLVGETWHLLDEATRLGHTVIVVSASPIAIVDAACELVHGPSLRAGVVAVVENGKYSPRVVPPIPYNEGKVANIDRLTPARPVLMAFGDNRFDIPMLQHARFSYAVRPKQALLDHAHEVKGLRLLEAL